MGKQNKYNKLGYFGKQNADLEMAKAYGIDTSQYGNQGRPGENYNNKKSYEDLRKDVASAAANDYDLRRSLEAAQLAGNKKAQKIGNVSNAAEAYAATRFMEKTHKNRMDNGGAYDGANDQAGVTNYWVNKDRNKLTESLTPEAPALIEPTKPEDQGPQFTIDAETANEKEAARDLRIEEYEKNRATNGFFGSDSANNYLDDYKLNVTSGLKKAGVPTRGPSTPSFIL